MKKRDKDNRPVFNLKNLNSNIPHQHIKMKGLFLFPGHKVCKIDLKNDYFAIPVSKLNVRVIIYLEDILLITSSLEDL